MTNKIFYVNGKDLNGHHEIKELLSNGWIVKSVTPESVATHTTSFHTNINASGGFVIVLGKS